MLGLAAGLGSLSWRRNEDYRDAVTVWRDATLKRPRNGRAHYNLGAALADRGRAEEAAAAYAAALQIDPGDVKAHLNQGVLLESLGRTEEAIVHYRAAVRLRPDYAAAFHNLGFALARQDRPAEAVHCLRKALLLHPRFPEALQKLAWLLATHPDPAVRDPGQAIALARRASELTGNRQPVVLDTLAAALAAAGRCPEAREVAARALQLAQDQGATDLAAAILSRLRRYEAGTPFFKRPAVY